MNGAESLMSKDGAQSLIFIGGAIVACFLTSRTDLLSSPRIAAGEALSLVLHLVSYRRSWKHRLKQNFIFSLVHWKRSLTPRGNTSHAQQYRFLTWPDVRTGLPWKIRDHNWRTVNGETIQEMGVYQGVI